MSSNIDDEIEEFRDIAAKNMIQFLEYIKGANVDFIRVKQRIKSVDSIKKKHFKLNISLATMADLVGVRIIVEDEKECFTVAQKLLDACQGNNLKYIYDIDYINQPRQTGYKAYHMYFLLNGMKAEIQIMTQEMEKFAEATHDEFKRMKYKEDENEDVEQIKKNDSYEGFVK